ncbi:hypothetical protein SAMN05660733_07101 [Lentzea albidocapillata]|uniref:Uncharacterized protein n=2 Tax=Lentzea albidocapillata TaxID=40571 RepID=A0A1W2FN13_9PSEU|nr:hypothetical protein SAMN05660733_07101 [Lentzea albidocapillata]
MAGLERLVEKYTGQKTQVSVNGVEGMLTGEQAQRVLDGRRAAWKLADKQGVDKQRPDAQVMGAVPVDAFNVSVQFIPVVGPPRRIKARGNWDFRDNYVNGSNPDDMSSVSVKLQGCMRILGTTTLTYDYRGNQTANAAYLKDSGLSTGAPISGIRDRVSGFVTNFDHGFTEVLVQNDCAAAQIGAAYAFEHNQDSNAGLSASAGWGFLSIAYTNITPALQKGSGPIYANF